MNYVFRLAFLRWLALCRLPGKLALAGWLGLLSLAAHAQRPTLRLDLLGGASGTDQAYVYFEQGASTSFDPNFDATKLANPSGLNLASFKANGQQYSINGLPLYVLSTSSTVALFVGVPQYGFYTLQTGQLANFPATTAYLVDNLLNTSTLLSAGTTYTFELTAANTNNTYTASNRFALLFTPPATPLPVTLTGFTAVAQAAGVRVAWATASEQHSAWFEVERSPDGQAFSAIGRMAAAGTSSQAHTYALLDAQPLAGVAYYRLRQVDEDGGFRYSPVRAVAGERTPGALHLFPSPARAEASLVGAAPGATAQLIDSRGRLIATALADAMGRATLLLPTDLAAGVYVVRTGTQTARLTVE